MRSRTMDLLLFTVLAGSPAAAETVERHLLAMGTELRVVVEADRREDALDASERAVAALRSAEARLSTWTSDSELSRFNAVPAGEPVPVSPPLARDLEAARRCGAETRGAFSPGMGSVVRAWGLREGGRRPDMGKIDSLLPALGHENLRIEHGLATRLDDRFVIEEGGFGKGAGLDDAVAALGGNGTAEGAVLNLGGQVAVWGSSSTTVGIADPRDRERVVAHLSIANGSVATSGNSERGIVVGGRRLGHVLDPQTGRPAPDFGSVTVWAPSGVEADCLATGLYVLGPDEALAWSATRPDVGVVVIERNGDDLRVRATPNLRGRIETTVANLELSFQ